ncbi:hypothetical protein B0T14DRAFT_585482 [Immersiella caudata]|uniref:Uncharacterized protein n=1 Tax=Immersiella caudata TaxID=314043 RepID=A0AA40C019_9PEZI|nr:hypothetical protein B0T14DRAFT_585482 [Immersiella caudata]
MEGNFSSSGLDRGDASRTWPSVNANQVDATVYHPRVADVLESSGPRILCLISNPSDTASACADICAYEVTLDRRKVKTDAALRRIPLVFFCGLHKDEGDKYGSPSKLALNLVLHLIEQYRDFDERELARVRDELGGAPEDVQRIMDVFSWLIERLPPFLGSTGQITTSASRTPSPRPTLPPGGNSIFCPISKAEVQVHTLTKAATKSGLPPPPTLAKPAGTAICAAPPRAGRAATAACLHPVNKRRTVLAYAWEVRAQALVVTELYTFMSAEGNVHGGSASNSPSSPRISTSPAIWQTASLEELNSTMHFSLAGTLALNMSVAANASTVNRMRYATLLDHSMLSAMDWETIIDPDPAWNYGVIECGFEQVFFSGTVECWIDVKSGIDGFSGLMGGFGRAKFIVHGPQLPMGTIKPLPNEHIQPSWRTRLRDFSGEFTLGGSPYLVLYPYTPSMLSPPPFLPFPLIFSPSWSFASACFSTAYFYSSHPIMSIRCLSANFLLLIERWATSMENIDSSAVTLTPLSVPPVQFANNFALLFNTFVTIAHCPECIHSSNFTRVATPDLTTDMPPEARALYTAVPGARRTYLLPGLFFALSWPWAATLLTSVVLLLIGVASIARESTLVAPDVLGYVSTLARNSKYLRLPGPADRGGGSG